MGTLPPVAGWLLLLAVVVFGLWLLFGESGPEQGSGHPEPKVHDHYYQSPDGEAPCTHMVMVEGRFMHEQCGLAWWQHEYDGYTDEDETDE